MFLAKGVFSVNNSYLWVRNSPSVIFVCLEICTDSCNYEGPMVWSFANVRHLSVMCILKNKRRAFPVSSSRNHTMKSCALSYFSSAYLLLLVSPPPPPLLLLFVLGLLGYFLSELIWKCGTCRQLEGLLGWVISLVVRPISTQGNTNTEETQQISMPRVGFE
jgi:hypothetical protein